MPSLVGDRPLSIRRSPTSRLVRDFSGNRLIFSRSSETGYQGVRKNRTSASCTCRPPLPARTPRASLRTCSRLLGNVTWYHDVADLAYFRWTPPTLALACGLHAFGGSDDVEELLRGERILFIGNSVVRRLVLTLLDLLRRPCCAAAVDRLRVGADPFAQEHSALDEGHGAATFYASHDRVHAASCWKFSPFRTAAAQPNIGCRETAACSQSSTLSYTFSGTPAEPFTLAFLRGWRRAVDARRAVNCSSLAARASVVVLQATTTAVDSWPAILDEAAALRAALQNASRRVPAFIVLSRTDVHPPLSGWEDRGDPLQAATEYRALARHQAALDALIRPRRGFYLAPVSLSTAIGVRGRVVRHSPDSSWHFQAPGRNLIAQTVLNALSLHRRESSFASSLDVRIRERESIQYQFTARAGGGYEHRFGGAIGQHASSLRPAHAFARLRYLRAPKSARAVAAAESIFVGYSMTVLTTSVAKYAAMATGGM